MDPHSQGERRAGGRSSLGYLHVGGKGCSAVRHLPIVVQLGPRSHAWGSCPRRNSSRVVRVPGRESGSRTRPSKTPTNAPRRAATNPPNKSRADFPHTELSSEDGVAIYRSISTVRSLGEADVTVRSDWTGPSWGPPFLGGISARPGKPAHSMRV